MDGEKLVFLLKEIKLELADQYEISVLREEVIKKRYLQGKLDLINEIIHIIKGGVG